METLKEHLIGYFLAARCLIFHRNLGRVPHGWGGYRYVCLTCGDKTDNHGYGSKREYIKTWKMTFWLAQSMPPIILWLGLPWILFSTYILGKIGQETDFCSKSTL